MRCGFCDDAKAEPPPPPPQGMLFFPLNHRETIVKFSQLVLGNPITALFRKHTSDIISFGDSDRGQEGSRQADEREYSDTHLWKKEDSVIRLNQAELTRARGHVSLSLSCHLSTCQQIMLCALSVCPGLGG